MHHYNADIRVWLGSDCVWLVGGADRVHRGKTNDNYFIINTDARVWLGLSDVYKYTARGVY